MTTISEKLHNYVTWNIVLLSLITIIVSLCNDDNAKYWRFGPQSDLYIVSIAVDTYGKYTILLIIIMLIKFSAIVGNDIRPILGSNIYNSDNTTVTAFKKEELTFYGSAIHFINNVRSILIILISISQADIALWSTLVAWSCSTFTIYALLNKKQFRSEEYMEISTHDTEEEEDSNSFEEVENENL